MKILQADCEHIARGYGYEDTLKHIERCGRVCYKSEDKITQGSAEKFVKSVIKRGHEAVLEHASFIVDVSHPVYRDLRERIEMLEDSIGFQSFLRFSADWKIDRFIVSGNVRAWRDFLRAHGRMTPKWSLPNFMEDFLKSQGILFEDILEEVAVSQYRWVDSRFNLITPAELVTDREKLIHWEETYLFTCDRGVSHEIVRHRPAGYCQESTRYCNYGLNGEVAVIKPSFLEEDTPAYHHWENACKVAEHDYCNMLINGCTPQEARAVLPNSLKTEVVMSTYMMEWRHFLELRCAKAAHPQMREVTQIRLYLAWLEAPELFEELWKNTEIG